MSDDLFSKSQLNFSNIAFLKSAPSLSQSPDDKGIEVAFVGRSNSGKSSAINTLMRKNALARTSKTPGRTQLINYFAIDADRRLVDLPGYGYAKIPKPIQQQIESLLSEYLNERQCLQGLIMLMDIRHPLMPSDKLFLDFVAGRRLPVHILLTKSDKLKRGASHQSLLQTREKIDAWPMVSVQTFSSLKGVGLDEARTKLTEWFTFD